MMHYEIHNIETGEKVRFAGRPDGKFTYRLTADEYCKLMNITSGDRQYEVVRVED